MFPTPLGVSMWQFVASKENVACVLSCIGVDDLVYIPIFMFTICGSCVLAHRSVGGMIVDDDINKPAGDATGRCIMCGFHRT